MLHGIIEKEFIVEPVYLPYSNTFLGKWRLLKFQKEVYDKLEKERNILLSAPTGSGKTLTLLLGTSYGGAVGIYPNNTLLRDQRESIDKILREALGAELIEPSIKTGEGDEESETLYIYSLGNTRKDRGLFEDYDYVAVAMISGKYVLAPKGKTKREVLVDNIIKKIQSLGKRVYKITLTTPDTMLLIMMSMYRDFEDVGKTLHNTLYAILSDQDPEHIVRKSRVAVREPLSKIMQIRETFFNKPLFIDEFHLYGAYELDALIPLLWINQNVLGSDTPVVLSSATPSEDVKAEIEESTGIRFDTVKAEPESAGRLIRGRTRVKLLLIEKSAREELRKYRGIASWIYLGDLIPDIISTTEIFEYLKQVVNKNKHAIIVLDKLYQVAETAKILSLLGLPVSCEASVKPPVCLERANIIVGSEAITQGINLSDAVFGLLVGYNSRTVIQRVGRIGRGTDSTIYMLTLYGKGVEEELGLIEKTNTINYIDFIKLIDKIYPNYDPKKTDPTNQYTDLHLTRRTLLKIIGITHIERTTGVKSLLEGIRDVKELIEQNKMMKILGTPNTIASLMMFRATGFTVKYIIKGTNIKGQSDIGVILRNFRVEDTAVVGSNVFLVITLEKARQHLVMRTSPYIPKPDISCLTRTVMPLGFLTQFGYGLYIEGQDGDNIELPITKEIAEHTITLLQTPEKIREYIVYTGRGILVEARGEPLVAVFL